MLAIPYKWKSLRGAECNCPNMPLVKIKTAVNIKMLPL